ncbi:MAG: hypothetical protein M1818_007561 [Claussenomyces sp. TS43310]|nr:MAG: hypothetical protein M1818_007561 [Claussenomyces sp. TS43310]
MEWTKTKASEYYSYCQSAVVVRVQILNGADHDLPWVEDKVLGWRGENKTSYTVKDQLSTDITGNKSVNDIQGGVANGVGGQLDNDGLLGGIGKLVSTEGINRSERDEFGAEKGKKGMTDALMGGSKES